MKFAFRRKPGSSPTSEGTPVQGLGLPNNDDWLLAASFPHLQVGDSFSVDDESMYTTPNAPAIRYSPAKRRSSSFDLPDKNSRPHKVSLDHNDEDTGDFSLGVSEMFVKIQSAEAEVKTGLTPTKYPHVSPDDSPARISLDESTSSKKENLYLGTGPVDLDEDPHLPLHSSSSALKAPTAKVIRNTPAKAKVTPRQLQQMTGPVDLDESIVWTCSSSSLFSLSCTPQKTTNNNSDERATLEHAIPMQVGPTKGATAAKRTRPLMFTKEDEDLSSSSSEESSCSSISYNLPVVATTKNLAAPQPNFDHDISSGPVPVDDDDNLSESSHGAVLMTTKELGKHTAKTTNAETFCFPPTGLKDLDAWRNETHRQQAYFAKLRKIREEKLARRQKEHEEQQQRAYALLHPSQSQLNESSGSLELEDFQERLQLQRQHSSASNVMALINGDSPQVKRLPKSPVRANQKKRRWTLFHRGKGGTGAAKNHPSSNTRTTNSSSRPSSSNETPVLQRNEASVYRGSETPVFRTNTNVVAPTGNFMNISPANSFDITPSVAFNDKAEQDRIAMLKRNELERQRKMQRDYERERQAEEQAEREELARIALDKQANESLENQDETYERTYGEHAESVSIMLEEETKDAIGQQREADEPDCEERTLQSHNEHRKPVRPAPEKKANDKIETSPKLLQKQQELKRSMESPGKDRPWQAPSRPPRNKTMGEKLRLVDAYTNIANVPSCDDSCQTHHVSIGSRQSVDSSLGFASSKQSAGASFLAPCIVCQAAERTHIAMPCMHYSFCQDCAEDYGQQNICPMCNLKNVTFNRVNL